MHGDFLLLSITLVWRILSQLLAIFFMIVDADVTDTSGF